MKKDSLSKASLSADHLTQSPSRESSERGDITPVVALNGILRNRHLLVGSAFVGAVMFATLAWFKPQSYTVTAILMPQGAKAPTGGVAGLASQVGIAIPGVDDNLQLYAELLKSREILRAVAQRPYTFATENGTRTSTLVDLYGGENQRLRTVTAVRKLGDQVSAAPATKTSTITVQVKAEYPELAHQVGQQLIDELNRFNLEQRQSQAGAERKFAERRMTEAQGELRTAENQLEGFLAQNREYRNSPSLSFTEDRLSRNVAMRQSIYSMLAQAYEQSKMDEIRDTPVITIIQPPETPLIPDGRGLIKNALFGLVLGLVFAILIAIVREYSGRQRMAETEELRDFDRLKAEAWYELRHPWMFVRKRMWRKRMA